MADDPIPGPGDLGPLHLRQAFPPVPSRDWEALVREDLKGADDARLVWRTGEGVDVTLFQRQEDLVGLDAQTRSVPGAPPFVRGDVVPWQAVEAPAWPADAIRADRLHDAGATAVQEIGWAIAEGVDRLAAAAAAGEDVAAAAAAVEFVFAVGSTYFIEIAKLRAARMLWGQAVSAFGVAAAPTRLHVRTARANKSVYDPYTNLLRATTEAMSAAIGGADTLLVEPHGFDPRLAINVQRLLAEEAHLDVVADPAGGSYHVEALTDALAREAWAAFQQIEAGGGYATYVQSGRRQQALQVARAAREEAVASRRRTLVGVNDYPDPAEKAPAAGPFPAADDDGTLAPLRLAAPFEALRARTARHAASTGRIPTVHLLTRGDMRMRTARAHFSLNLFGCAGFDITQGEALPADAALIVLCSADAEYPAIAREVVPAVSVPVIVAGDPGDRIDALVAAGVQGVVHARSDAVQVLTQWQDRLGLAT